MRKGWALWIGIFAMFFGTVAVIIGILAWGGGGKQRGLVVRNESGRAAVVRFERGPELELAQGQEQTVAARRGDYPQTISVSDASGNDLWQRQLTFADLSDNSFRLVIGPAGLIPTPPQSNG